MSETEVTDPLSWLDAEFVQTVLRDEEDDAALEVVRHEVKRAGVQGDNFCSNLLRVFTEFRRGNQKSDDTPEVRSLIVKSLPVSPMILHMVKMGRMFDKESYMYAVTLPAMYNIISEKIPRETPAVFSSHSYRTPRPDTIILEDLKPLGYKMVDRRQFVDLAHCKLVMKALGRFHGVSRALLDHDSTSLDQYVEALCTEENRSSFEQMMLPSINAQATVIESWAGFERFGDKIRKFGETSFSKMVDIFKAKPDKFSVLTHGDCWVNNMLFKYSEATGEVEDVRFVDFQMSRFGSPALDLLYFFYSSVGNDLREHNMDALLEEYHASLCDTMESLDLDRDALTMADLKQALEDNAFVGLFTATSLLAMVVAEPSETVDLDTLTEENWKQVENNPLFDVFRSKTFRSIYEKLLLHFEHKGQL